MPVDYGKWDRVAAEIEAEPETARDPQYASTSAGSLFASAESAAAEAALGDDPDSRYNQEKQNLATEVVEHEKRVRLVLDRLNSTEHELRATAVEALSELIGLAPSLVHEHAPRVAKLLDDGSEKVRISTLRLVAKLDPEQLRWFAAAILRRLHGSDAERELALELVPTLGSGALSRNATPLVADLHSTKPGVRVAALVAYAGMGAAQQREHVGAVVAMLADADDECGEAAACALRGLPLETLEPQADAIGALCRSAPRPAARERAAKALCLLPATALAAQTDAIGAALDDAAAPGARQAAVFAFEKLDGAAAVARLAERIAAAATDATLPDRSAAVAALGRADMPPARAAAAALACLGQGGEGEGEGAAGPDDAAVRAAAVEVLGKLDAAAHADALARCLGDGYWGVRAAAVEALGSLPGGAAHPSLRAHRAALEKCRDDDDDDDVRAAAARLLGGRGGVVV